MFGRPVFGKFKPVDPVVSMQIQQNVIELQQLMTEHFDGADAEDLQDRISVIKARLKEVNDKMVSEQPWVWVFIIKYIAPGFGYAMRLVFYPLRILNMAAKHLAHSIKGDDDF